MLEVVDRPWSDQYTLWLSLQVKIRFKIDMCYWFIFPVPGLEPGIYVCWASNFTAELHPSPPSAYLMHKYCVPFKPPSGPKSRNSPVIFVGRMLGLVETSLAPHSSTFFTYCCFETFLFVLLADWT